MKMVVMKNIIMITIIISFITTTLQKDYENDEDFIMTNMIIIMIMISGITTFH